MRSWWWEEGMVRRWGKKNEGRWKWVWFTLQFREGLPWLKDDTKNTGKLAKSGLSPWPFLCGCPFSPVSLQPLRALHGRALLSALTNPHVPSMQVSGSLPLLSCLLKLIRLLQAKVLIAKNVLTPKSILSKMVHLKKRRKDQTQPSRT